ncbi:TetR/AcrR family transcriptional regulator [Speluncibacter jeojiensis]|uniref:TetR/AcrR family transcriptional regulator n=1 Tax=Speluncibacter jeojiensis TaxID=2710754 RepID=A0A9X4M165_9ACTN|nr:TetR/AcrR family transcriptional regulator [Corynebacteriales bacterium D3-21]
MSEQAQTAARPAGAPSDTRATPDGRATRWDEHKAQRREQILDAAIASIDESGTDVGVQQIAERAGVPRSVVYRIFKDRGDLDEQLRARILDRLLTHIAPALHPEGTVGEAISRAVSTYLSWIVESPRLHQFLGIGSPSRRTTGSRAVTGTKTAIGVQLTTLLESVLTRAGRDPAPAEPLAFGLIGLVDVSVNRWLTHPTIGSEELAAFLEVSLWQVLDANLRRLGVAIDPATPISELS